MVQHKSISVAMCTYNGEAFLKEQLESIAGQTRLPAEVVVCDDRSTDRTAEIVREFAETAPFPVRLNVNRTNLGGSAKGITRNFEQAVGLCVGDLIATCDQDDVWLPQKLERLAGAMEADPELGGVFSDATLIDQLGMPKGSSLSKTLGFSNEDEGRLARGEALPVLLAMTKVYGCSLLFDAAVVKRTLPVPAHWWFDAWVACMVGVHTKLGFVREPLFCYRIHAAQSVSAAAPTASERLKQWRQSAKEYWEMSAPQLMDLESRLAAEDSPRVQASLDYVRGRMRLLQFRAKLPAGRVRRTFAVLSEARSYARYFNGWKSVAKDLTS